LNCAYHGWTYTLDGRLIGTPEIDGLELFDRSTLGMVPLRCATWEQFIFVNFDREARPLTEFLGDIPQKASDFRFEGLALTERRDYVVKLLARVSEEERMLLMLKEVEGFSVEELAERTGMNENTIKVKLFRARQKLVKAAQRLDRAPGLVVG